MKEIKAELKTYHTITFELDELNEMLANPQIYTNEPKQLTGAGYFGMMKLTKDQRAELCYQLGFSTTEHVGIYHKDKKQYVLTFVDFGDTMERRI